MLKNNSKNTEYRTKVGKSSISKNEKFIISDITKRIGRGQDASNSIVYLVIKWAFWVGAIITLIVAINYWIFREKEKVPDFIGDISTLWDIIVPIITLALGYHFGKSNKIGL